jgi:hypothetical protein
MQVQCDRESFVELTQLALRQAAYVVRERGFGQTDQLIAVNGAIVLQALFNSHEYLRRKAMVSRVDRCTND